MYIPKLKIFTDRYTQTMVNMNLQNQKRIGEKMCREAQIAERETTQYLEKESERGRETARSCKDKEIP